MAPTEESTVPCSCPFPCTTLRGGESPGVWGGARAAAEKIPRSAPTYRLESRPGRRLPRNDKCGARHLDSERSELENPPRCTHPNAARAVGEGRHHVLGAANSFAGGRGSASSYDTPPNEKSEEHRMGCSSDHLLPIAFVFADPLQIAAPCRSRSRASGQGVADHEVHGIHLAAVLLHLVVQVRAAHEPRCAHVGDAEAAIHRLPRAHVQP